MELFVFFNRKKKSPPQKKDPFVAPKKVAEMCRADLRFVKLLRDQIHQRRAIQFSGHETVLPGGNRNEKNTERSHGQTRREASFFGWVRASVGFFWSLNLTRFFLEKNAV